MEEKNQITFYPTYTKVNNYVKGSNKYIERSLSVWDKATFSYSFEGYIVDDEDNLYLPAGYDKELIMNNFRDYDVVDKRIDYHDMKKSNTDLDIKYSPRDEVQRTAIQFLADNKYDLGGYQKFLSLKTGQGKTFCAVYYICMTSRIPMIFVPNKILADQWIDRIMEYTNAEKENIYLISGSRSVDKLYKMSDEDRSSIKFYITIHKTTDMMYKDDPNSLRSLFDKLGISVKIFDEAHLRWESILNIDMNTECRSIYLTATGGRSDPMEDKVYKRIFKMTPKFSDRSKKVKVKPEKYHNVVIFKYKLNADEEFKAKLMKRSAKRGFDINFYTDYITNEKFSDFYEPLKNFILKAVYPESSSYIRKTMVLVKHVELLEKLYDRLLEDLDGRNITIAKKHSKMSKTDKEIHDLDKADLIITTDSSMGTGSDIKGLEMVISTIPTSSDITTTQILGRLREIESINVYFVDYVDVSLEKCRLQLKSRINKVYKKHALTIKEIGGN